MRVLLLGSGGREHAIGWKLKQSPSLETLISAPGNPGLATCGAVLPTVDIMNADAVVEVALTNQVDLVVVGPEAPLAAGIADALNDSGFAVCGPTTAGARLEASKAYAKEIMRRVGVPTAPARSFTDAERVTDYLEELPGPYVVKADGLAAGKGVLVTEDRRAAQLWARSCIAGRFGDAGETVVIEEWLEGDELSVMALCDGKRALALPAARDYKRLRDGDRGPNTGGMGCFSPVKLPHGLVAEVMKSVIEPVLAELAADGVTYRGFLYAGLVLTDEGPKVLEFNCRLGDPEAQVLLPRLDEDLLELLSAAASGVLPDRDLRISEETAVDVVLGASGYPDNVEAGDVITGITDAENIGGVHVFHAGTVNTREGLTTAGGRVLNVVATGENLAEARRTAYAGAARINFAGKHYRSDIGVG